MSAHSVKLMFEDGTSIYISPNRARRLRKQKLVTVSSFQPFVLQSKRNGFIGDFVQRWTSVSDQERIQGVPVGGVVMSGAALNRRPPRP